MSVISLLRDLIEIPSPSGDEKDIVEYLKNRLGKNFCVNLQLVEKDRYNIIATSGTPKLLFNIHTDTVPGRYKFEQRKGYVYGRGAVDAKGPMAAMIIACERAVKDGYTNFGICLDVGEEVDFCGLKKFRQAKINAEKVIVCEPTNLGVTNRQKGLLEFKLVAKGKSAHSARPEEGDCAITKLLLAIERVRSIPLSEDELLGKTIVALTKIRGGNSINVVAEKASAEFCIRTVRGDEKLLKKIKGAVVGLAEVEILNEYAPIISDVEPIIQALLENYEPTLASGFTGMYFWKNSGSVIILGPGDPSTAHTGTERISVGDLERGVTTYFEIIKILTTK